MSTDGPRCLNCAAPLEGRFCGTCGQAVRDADISFREIVHEVAETFTNVDGAAIRSFRGLLWPPGRFTASYLSGQRARYLPPLRLYLLCSLAFVLTREVRDRIVPQDSSLLDVSTTIERDDGTVQVLRGDSAVRVLLDSSRVQPEPGLFARVVRGALTDPVTFRARVREDAPKAFFILVPTFAALLGLAFRRGRPGYGRHLLVAMHLHSMGFVFFALGHLVALIPGPTRAFNVGLVATLGLAPSVLRTVYQVSPWQAVVRLLLILVPYLNVVGVVTALVIGRVALRG